jgi:superfamily I DNA/RNA helicase
MSLTLEQRASLWDATGRPVLGRRVLSARAGTGKTKMLGQYVADLLADWHLHFAHWQGIALLSYTNIASKEIESRLPVGNLGHPHFAGTIDSFVNRFIFLPHGAQSMGASIRPRLVGEPHFPWRAKTASLADKCFASVQYLADSTINVNPSKLAAVVERRADQVSDITEAIRSRKRALNAAGYATQSDSNHFSAIALRDNTRIARALAFRFPVIIVDEAQDMTESQHILIDLLVQSGLANAVLVGDEFQAIYEWNTAKPELFISKASSSQWSSASISGSFRCSPSICSSLNALSGGEVIVPVNGSKNAGYPSSVTVVHFDSDSDAAATDLAALIDGMASSISGRNAHSGEASLRLAVLTRSNDDAAHLRGLFSGRSIGRPSISLNAETRIFASLVYYSWAGNKVKAVSSYEKLVAMIRDFESLEVMRKVLAEEWAGPGASILDYRKHVLSELSKIRQLLSNAVGPGQEPKLCHSKLAVPSSLPGIESGQLDSIRLETSARPNTESPALSFIFGSAPSMSSITHPQFYDLKLSFSTIHSVKGETYDGVLYVLRKQGLSCGCPQKSNRTIRIAGHALLQCESKRLMYVAMSRAAQVLCVAVQSDLDLWEQLLIPSTL